jgi:hypothetical protein
MNGRGIIPLWLTLSKVLGQARGHYFNDNFSHTEFIQRANFVSLRSPRFPSYYD